MSDETIHAPHSPLGTPGFDAPFGWRWVAWFAVSVAIATLAVMVFNIGADPTGTFGTGWGDTVSKLPRDRAAKVALLQRGDPDLVVLGTSRAQQIDPADIDPSAKHPVNAAVVGGDLFEDRVFTAYLADRAKHDGSAFPHLVVGVDVEGFRPTSLRGSGLLGVPAVASIARREAGKPSRLELVPQLPELTLTWDITHASYEALRQRRRANATRKLHAVDRTAATSEFTAHGVPRATAKAWSTKSKLSALERATERAIQPSIERYRGRYDDVGGRLAGSSTDDLAALLRTARRAGDTPLVFISPIHPTAKATLDPIGRTKRHKALITLLRRDQRAGLLTFVDCSNCVPGDLRNWLDGIHTSPLGSEVLAHELAKRAAPAR